jgi:hypothetical protein
MSKLFTRFSGWCAWAFGHPLAFILACLATLAWAVTGPVFNYSDTWQLVINTGTTVATFLMIFVLQHSQNRDATAIQAKLDELIQRLKNCDAMSPQSCRIKRVPGRAPRSPRELHAPSSVSHLRGTPLDPHAFFTQCNLGEPK